MSFKPFADIGCMTKVNTTRNNDHFKKMWNNNYLIKEKHTAPTCGRLCKTVSFSCGKRSTFPMELKKIKRRNKQTRLIG